jgi:adenylate cyclase
MTEPDPTPTLGDLERAILGESPGLNAFQVSELAGVSVDQARRLWRALGFPEHAGETAFTQADADALTTVTDVLSSRALDFDTVVNLTRGVGQTMARLADWEVGTLVGRIEEIEAGDDAQGSRRAAALLLVDRVNEPFERLLIYAWRRHLAAATARMEALGANEEDLHTVEVTVGFADIVAFTALSNRLDDDGIGDLVEVFESRCADIVAAHGGRVIKSIGDSVLFVHEDALEAVATAEEIIDAVGRDKRLPDVRLGLATGSVVMRMGDVFGRPVNLAARLTAVARRNRVIVDEATAAVLPPEDFGTRRMPARPIHGFGLVEPLTLSRRS